MYLVLIIILTRRLYLIVMWLGVGSKKGDQKVHIPPLPPKKSVLRAQKYFVLIMCYIFEEKWST